MGRGGTDRCDAYALRSMSASLGETQWAYRTASVYFLNPPRAVHARIAELVFGERIAGRVAGSMRPEP
jgi:hypothetical protein